MTRLTAIAPDQATGKTKELFTAIQGKLGTVPNIMKTMGNSPAVLDAYLKFGDALSYSKIGGQLGELIALTVAEANSCEYCAAAHSFIAEKLAKVDQETIFKTRKGESIDPKTDAALHFVKLVVVQRGNVADKDVDKLKEAGYSEGEVAEIIAHTSLNIFTNYFNHIAGTEVDFPKVEILSKVTV